MGWPSWDLGALPVSEKDSVGDAVPVIVIVSATAALSVGVSEAASVGVLVRVMVNVTVGDAVAMIDPGSPATTLLQPGAAFKT
jgi:hypothetical protein